MISSNFGFGEQSKIASAYAQMYAPKSKMEESCCKGGCGGKKPAKKTEKKVVKEACADGGLVRKHVEPKKTGSKLGARKMMEFKKRDAKPSCKGCAPKAKKVNEGAMKALAQGAGDALGAIGNLAQDAYNKVKEDPKGVLKKAVTTAGNAVGNVVKAAGNAVSGDLGQAKDNIQSVFGNKKNESAEPMRGFCIVDGNKTLCTNDVNESYFSKDGITGETRIYESAVSALKDIKKVNARRKPNSKYCIRKCECVGESFQFVQSGSKVDESEKVNEGFFDGITNAIGSAVDTVGGSVGGLAKGLTDAGSGLVKGVGDVAGRIPVAGGVINGITNAVGDAVSGVGNTVNSTATGLTGAGSGLVKGIGNAVQGGADSVSNYFTKDDKKTNNLQPLDAEKAKKEQEAAVANSGAAMYGDQQQTQSQPQNTAQYNVQQNNAAQNNLVSATTPTQPSGADGVAKQNAAINRKAEEVKGKTTTTTVPNASITGANTGTTVTEPDSTSASVAIDNVAKDNGFENTEDFISAADKMNNLGDLTKKSTEAQIAAEKGHTVPQMKEQSAANKAVMSNATPQQKNEISKMLRSRNNPNNTNAPTMNDVQAKINTIAQQNQQQTASQNGRDASASAQQSQSGENNPGYQQELKALKMKWGVK